MIYRKIVKRLLDIIVSSLMLIVLSPLLLILSILVRTKLGSPILFRQERPGYKGKIFIIYKFRTMLDANDENGESLPDEVRLTAFGSKLRKTSLDELPELINIFKGEMSFVGPRPLLVRYLPRYSKEQARRHDVKPGLTGWAQVNGRNAITWDDKFKYDVEYVDKLSFIFDLKVVFKTISVVFHREGITEDGNVTMTEFLGNENDSSEQ